MTTSAAATQLRHQLLLLLVELLRLGLGVAGLGLGVLRLQAELDELAAQAFDLLLDDRPRVVGLDDGAEPLGRADRLQARHAGADDEDAGRR